MKQRKKDKMHTVCGSIDRNIGFKQNRYISFFGWKISKKGKIV